jgi:phosphoglycerate dehydrogenase-like enzyme
MALALLHSLALGSAHRSVLITDGGSACMKSLLSAAGLRVVERHLTAAELAGGCLAEHDAVIVRSATTLEAGAIAAGAAGALRVIGRAGVGVDNIDVASARRSRCWVLNSAGASTNSVVELTLAHLLGAARRVSYADRQLRSGVWVKGKLGGGHELRGKRLGLVGFGRIARGVAAAASALGMEVHAISPSASHAEASALGVTLHSALDDLFSTCTHVSIHRGLNAHTAGAVSARRLALMPSVAPNGTPCGSHLINLARGGVVDEAAAADALRDGILTSYCADVFSTEPLPADSTLLSCDGFVGTPHVGGETAEAQERVGAQLAQAVIAALDGRVPEAGVVCNPGVDEEVEL